MKQKNLNKPNLFRYGYKELSQDAMICWLLDWANEKYAKVDEAVHKCGQAFARALFGKHEHKGPDEINKVELYMQVAGIDVLAWINNKYAILIEDKTDTGRHDNQLKRYHEKALGEKALGEKFCISSNSDSKQKTLEISGDKFFPIFLKTGNMSKNDREAIKNLGLSPQYKIFERQDFLEVLNKYEGDHPILTDFRQHLQAKEDDFQSYKEVTSSELTGDAWQGLFCCLESEIGLCGKDNDGWGYVNNPAGGFWGLWWCFHPIPNGDRLYLQLEQEKLCFKISVEDKSAQIQRRQDWHEKVMKAGGSIEGIEVERPNRFGAGLCMTVAMMKGEWLQFSNSGMDIDATVKVLKKAEKVLDKALELSTKT